MLEIPSLLEPLFRAAGWQGPKKSFFENPPVSAQAIASHILDEFGGLLVGSSEPGTEMIASNVRFYKHIRLDQSVIVQPWERQIGKVAAFASAHDEYMVLFAGANGSFYVFTDPDEQLYVGPQDFGELMRRLLWGYPYGPTIPKDAHLSS